MSDGEVYLKYNYEFSLRIPRAKRRNINYELRTADGGNGKNLSVKNVNTFLPALLSRRAKQEVNLSVVYYHKRQLSSS